MYGVDTLLVCLQFAWFGNAEQPSEDLLEAVKCPKDWTPINDQCYEFNTIAIVPYEAATVLCKESGGLITVQSDPVEVGQYIAKEHPGKDFWVGATSNEGTCVVFSGLKPAYTQEDCRSNKYYVCHLQTLQKHINDSTEHKGFRHHIKEAFGTIGDAFELGWKNVKDVFTYDEEALENERVVDGCKAMMYHGVVHTGCTTRGSSTDKEWCGTDGGIFWPGISNWKYC